MRRLVPLTASLADLAAGETVLEALHSEHPNACLIIARSPLTSPRSLTFDEAPSIPPKPRIGDRMPPGNPARLLQLADREYRQLTAKPAPSAPTRKFKPIKLNAARFDSGWDRKRGAAVRLTAVVLRDDDAALERRVCGGDKTAKTYAQAAAWLQRESAYPRKGRGCSRPPAAALRLC
jgi:hypothetical protein